MGWTAEQVRATHPADLRACYKGYLITKGVNPNRRRPTREWHEGLLERARAYQAKIKGNKSG